MTASRVQRALALFCFDGSNIVRGSFGYGGGSFQEQEQEDADAERLVAALAQLAARLQGRADIQVFFDGSSQAWAGRQQLPENVTVRFTRSILPGVAVKRMTEAAALLE